jgi:hypothetical protein
VLSPGVRAISVGHALNADYAENAVRLGGLSDNQFLRSDENDVSGATLTAAELRSNTDLYSNADNAPGASSIYFDGAANQWLRWQSGRFELSGEMWIDGDLEVNGNELFLWDGKPSNFAIAINFGLDESLLWNDVLSRFELSDTLLATEDLIANGEVSALGNQIVINNNGPNRNQGIEFYHDSPQFERFQWDDTASRFEVSDDFHAFGELSASGAKPFIQNHPHRDDLEIVYTALEGNEGTTFPRRLDRAVRRLDRHERAGGPQRLPGRRGVRFRGLRPENRVRGLSRVSPQARRVVRAATGSLRAGACGRAGVCRPHRSRALQAANRPAR